MASALMAAYLRIVAFTLCDIEIYLRMVNKFFFLFFCSARASAFQRLCVDRLTPLPHYNCGGQAIRPISTKFICHPIKDQRLEEPEVEYEQPQLITSYRRTNFRFPAKICMVHSPHEVVT
jgi:hypothetical protein